MAKDLKLQAEKWYKRRDGLKAYCRGTSVFSHRQWTIEVEARPYFVYCTGRSTAMGESGDDIIEEWRDPRELSACVVMVENAHGEVFLDFAVAQDSNAKIVGATTVKVKEGLGILPTPKVMESFDDI